MYGSLLAGTYGVKFLKGESSGAPAGLAGVADAALDLVFIDFCSESLDCFAGDCFRVEVLAAFLVAGAFLLVADDLLAAFAEALPAVAAFALDRAGVLLRALACAAALPAALVLGAVLLLGRALAFGLAAVLFLAAAFAVALALLADLAAGPCFFGDCFFAGCFFAGCFFADCFFTEPADALAAPFAAAFVLALEGVFAPFFAAMFCLWFLTFRSWPRTSDAGK
ncbi:MAG: hypothetical protein U5Q16_06035 [Gammaproteobacteria bacterium]|nr:hypothetical protein [Gammaproteobacteria bacterium]